MAKRERNVIKDLFQCFQLFCQCKQFNDATSFHALQGFTLSADDRHMSTTMIMDGENSPLSEYTLHIFASLR